MTMVILNIVNCGLGRVAEVYLAEQILLPVRG